jgi:hypothetical protein
MSALANGLPLARTEGLDQAPPPVAAVAENYLRCDFCRRGRDQVVRLIVKGHAAICSECLGDAVALLRADVAGERISERAAAPAAPVARPPANGHAPPPGGYTGSMCGECGNFRMVRTGTCETCLDCYATGGCG